MKLNLKFFTSWIVGAVIMYSLFYLWHGVFLNDFKKINFPLTWLLIFTSVAYITISFLTFLVFESKPLKNIYNFFVRGLVAGALVGFVIFIVSTVVTISISRHLTPEHLMLDCIWQITEQTIGGLSMALIKVLITHHQHEEA